MGAPVRAMFTKEHEGSWVAHNGGIIIDYDKSVHHLMEKCPDIKGQRRIGKVVSLTFVPVGFIR